MLKEINKIMLITIRQIHICLWVRFEMAYENRNRELSQVKKAIEIKRNYA